MKNVQVDVAKAVVFKNVEHVIILLKLEILCQKIQIKLLLIMFSFFLIDQFNTNDFTRQFFNLDISKNVTVDKVLVFNNNNNSKNK